MRSALAALLLLAAAAPTVTVDVKEWPVPFKGHPRDPFPDAAGESSHGLFRVIDFLEQFVTQLAFEHRRLVVAILDPSSQFEKKG